MKQYVKYINNEILRLASKLQYTVSDKAPNTEQGLLNSPTLVIWSGESSNTIFQDATVNWAFRALHDAMHIKSGLSFSHSNEIELGRIQASQFDSSLMQELFYCEISLQAMYHKETGLFLLDQKQFTLDHLTKKGLIK